MAIRDELAAVLARIVSAPSEFYRRRLAEAGVADATTFERLPLTRRAELLRDQLDHLPHGTRRCADAAPPVRAGITGSGAELLVLTWTAADLARERAAGVRLLRRLGIEPGMRVANTLPGALVTPGSLLLGDVIEELGGLDVPLGAIESDAAARQAWELVDRVHPDIIVLEPASSARLLNAAPPAARPWWQGIVWLQRGAAPTEESPLPPAAGFNGWQRIWLAVPEATSFVAFSCAASRFHADGDVMAEIVDDTLVLTPLGADTPVLRYASGVSARAVSGGCPCGSDGTAIELT